RSRHQGSTTRPCNQPLLLIGFSKASLPLPIAHSPTAGLELLDVYPESIQPLQRAVPQYASIQCEQYESREEDFTGKSSSRSNCDGLARHLLQDDSVEVDLHGPRPKRVGE